MQFNFYHKTIDFVRNSLSKHTSATRKGGTPVLTLPLMIHRHNCQASTSSYALENKNLHS